MIDHKAELSIVFNCRLKLSKGLRLDHSGIHLHCLFMIHH